MRLINFLPRRWWSPRAWRVWASYLHWRLETYGAFYPSGKINLRALRSLIRQTPSYLRWVGQIERLRSRKFTPL